MQAPETRYPLRISFEPRVRHHHAEATLLESLEHYHYANFRPHRSLKFAAVHELRPSEDEHGEVPLV